MEECLLLSELGGVVLPDESEKPWVARVSWKCTSPVWRKAAA
jgi:hypothetical protein